MIKKLMFLTIAAFTLVACGDDDPEVIDNPQDTKYTKLVSTAKMQFSADLIRIADITIYYMKEGGEVAHEIVSDSVWENSVTQTIPCQTGLAITYSVKPELTLSAEDKFDLVHSGKFTITPYTEKGQAGAANLHTITKTNKGVNGDKVAELLSRRSVNIGYTYTTDGKRDTTNIEWGF